MVVPFGALDTAPVVVASPLNGPCEVGPVGNELLWVSAAPGSPGAGGAVSIAEICESVPKLVARFVIGDGV